MGTNYHLQNSLLSYWYLVMLDISPLMPREGGEKYGKNCPRLLSESISMLVSGKLKSTSENTVVCWLTNCRHATPL
jgi:hypothetical protein